MEKVTLNIKGATCSHCRKSLKKNISQLTGVRRIKVNARNECVKISFDSSVVTLYDLTEIIRSEGYDISMTEAQNG